MALAAWPSDPTINVPICTFVQNQTEPEIVSDGAGGAIIVWEDFRPTSGTVEVDIYAQRVDATGSVTWTADGVGLCTYAGWQRFPVIVSDGAGGAIVAWEDSRGVGKDVYAQRVNANGTPQWTADGVALCTFGNDQMRLAITTDGSGGAIVTWDDRRGGPFDVYAQRVNASGVPQWTADGVAVSVAASNQEFASVATDGLGGAIITWQDFRTFPADIYAQRLNASGVAQWTDNGVALCTAVDTQTEPLIISDGAGGAVITWTDGRAGSASLEWDIYVQKVNASGVPQWAADGVALCTVAKRQWLPAIATDGAGGAIVTWVDQRNGWPSYDDILAQRVDGSGVPQWTADGVVICGTDGSQADPGIVSDGAGGAIIAWGNPPGDIFGQRVDASGVSQWTADGDSVSAAAGGQSGPVLVSAGVGSAIVAWDDTRSGTSTDVYAQRVPLGGVVGIPEGDLPSAVWLAAASPNPSRGMTMIRLGLPHEANASLLLFDAAGRRVRTLIDTTLPAGEHLVEWDGRDAAGARARSGFYIMRLQVGETVRTAKLIVAQ
jgi:predicted lipoprotein with Yx(FWY)xxD motif